MDRRISLVTDTDSYKLGHFKQYPKGTTAMSSYFESRGGDYDKTLFFGLQYILKNFLTEEITMEDVEYMASFAKRHGLSFNYNGWAHIVLKLGGKIPVKIRAVPEGSVVPTGNILMDVTSTDEESFWIVSWIETILSRLWYPTTVATRSWYMKDVIKKFLKETADGDPEETVLFKLHDFGSRGVSCQEQAMIGGAAHLVSFRGSDTLVGIEMAHQFYNCDMAGYSIEASEHSTMTLGGKDKEIDAFRNMIKQYGDNPIFACVSDSYDIYKACSELWGKELKQNIIDMNATLVVRPDSGDPIEVSLKVIEILEERFGVSINSKGYKLLNHVRVIWGDGIGPDDVYNILSALKTKGYSTDNIAFGMGGGLLQKLDRDTQKFAFKASWACVNGKNIDIYKEPITDSGKNSKRGRLDLVEYGDGQILTTSIGRNYHDATDLLETVFENGEIVKEYTFDEIRDNSKNKVYSQYKGWKQWTEPWEEEISK